jgi:hypothetical protein
LNIFLKLYNFGLKILKILGIKMKNVNAWNYKPRGCCAFGRPRRDGESNLLESEWPQMGLVLVVDGGGGGGGGSGKKS